MRVHPHIPVGEIAASMPHVTKLFDVFGVDYVLHGKLSLRDACAEAGVDPAVVKHSIEEMPRAAGEEPHWSDASVGDLADELEQRRHPRLRVMMSDLASMIASAPPGVTGLSAMRDAYTKLFLLVEPHLHREEHALLPLVREIEQSWKTDRRPLPKRSPALGAPVAALEEEHVRIIHALNEVKDAAAGLSDDDGMCGRLLDCVTELAAEIRDQIHLANNVLYQRALALEEAMSRS